MIEFNVHLLFPDFILADKNGYAMAKAIERAMQIVCDTVQRGIECVQDVSKMPEWRIDEMAWELGCLYDYGGSIENKRYWISESTPLYASLGTPQAIYNFLNGFFDDVELEENWQYSGEPFHFRVTVSGEWTDANEAWARKAIASSKNVRSILDDISVGSRATISVHAEGAMLAKFPYAMTQSNLFSGVLPNENMVGRVVDAAYLAYSDEAKGFAFPYPAAGTKPQENTVGARGESTIRAEPVSDAYRFPYRTPGEDDRSGTEPDMSVTGAIADGSVPTQSDGKATAFSYSPCSGSTLCGDDF